MHRFKIGELSPDVFLLQGEERDHLVKVLRITAGVKILGFDNSGREYLAEVEHIGDKAVVCRILEVREPEVEAKSQVFLVTGLAKGDKLEWVIQKSTELGMAGLVPLRTKRAVVRLEGGKAQERVKRWQKIATEAAKQSRRVKEPYIFEVADWEDLPGRLPANTQWLMPYEEERSRGLRQILGELNPEHPIAVLIGPEGGFEEDEVAWAKTYLKAHSVSLGPRILRAETAAIAALTMVLAGLGDLG